MQVSTMNNYQALNSFQQPVIQPIDKPSIQPVPQEPDYTNEDIYKASDGNLILDKDGELTLTPQGQTNLNNAIEDKKAQSQAEEQAKKDATRTYATGVLEANSVKSRVEIYLAVATDGEYDNNSSTADVISSLRDVQKQNNAVEAYATYKEAQDGISTYM